MKAAVLTAPERMETVDDWPEPVCGPGDVVIEPHHACLTCAGCLTGLTSACPHRAIAGLNAPGGDFTAALTELPDARPGAVIEARFPLARAQEAFAGAAGRAGKTWIRLGSEHE
ncbi:hypothetical protein M2163_001860 [Streptomyces sp. SAI-135]|uniref:alcohol dehydrogenase catalytic domain-containing protein n=1 Tax=unclassified Streptomyces TaxID=2593676 RepID=UPI002476BBD0|nr:MULTISPECIES: alcohol dehydrogenase catalytic domain-containing protein [unclassified Streptomyces]MDH6521154.1 hypothetical protein [Streptomyces sp. SAI-090]MDH6614752.1 hypothetical protein [Streptomyces sp. SAI-135]